MTQCFKEHACDSQSLHRNTRNISDCESYLTRKHGRNFKITDVPILTCECIWRSFQKEAEDIVAPGGTLIADPKARNRAINAAYARLWLHDPRFQWAGLAAFASKQVGCGLLHAADTEDRLNLAAKMSAGGPRLTAIEMQLQYRHVHDMLALGNTTLFLDIFPLHAFYKKRGLKELAKCLPARQNIYGNDQHPVLWPVNQKKLTFGLQQPLILQAFEAIDAGQIADSVKHLAWHEQQNILQPAMYSDSQLVRLMRLNQFAYVTAFPSGVAEAIELTLASQCRRVGDGRTIGFSNDPMADLSDINQRMPFVLKAAARFDELLHNRNRAVIEQSLQDIAAGGGVR